MQHTRGLSTSRQDVLLDMPYLRQVEFAQTKHEVVVVGLVLDEGLVIPTDDPPVSYLYPLPAAESIARRPHGFHDTPAYTTIQELGLRPELLVG